MSLKEVPDGGAGVEIARSFASDYGRQVWKASWPGVATVDDGVEFYTGLWLAARIARALHPCTIVRASFQIFGDGCACCAAVAPGPEGGAFGGGENMAARAHHPAVGRYPSILCAVDQQQRHRPSCRRRCGQAGGQCSCDRRDGGDCICEQAAQAKGEE